MPFDVAATGGIVLLIGWPKNSDIFGTILSNENYDEYLLGSL